MPAPSNHPPHTYHRVRSDMAATRFRGVPLAVPCDTMRDVSSQTTAYVKGEITAEAAIAGIVQALCMSDSVSEVVSDAEYLAIQRKRFGGTPLEQARRAALSLAEVA